MARTNTSKVKEILGDNYGPKLDGNLPNLQPFIDAASLVVSRVAICAAAKGMTLSGAELEMIERWLSAHGYALMDQTRASDSTDGASASFHGQTGMGLESTRYGQYAMTLDYSGCLSAIAKRRFGGMTWLGKTKTEQLSFDERN